VVTEHSNNARKPKEADHPHIWFLLDRSELGAGPLLAVVGAIALLA
jgi:hypothetical protein